MRDLREVGQKVIDSIMKMKPTDAGDLAIGVEGIISDLRSNPAQFQEKLDHLEGLFKELAYGEEYALREKVEDKEEDDVLGSLFGGFNGAMSGTIPPIAVSYKLPVSKQITAGHHYHSPPLNVNEFTPVDNPCGEVALGEPEECSLPAPPTDEEILESFEMSEPEEPEPEVDFKPKWWQRRVK